MGLTRIRVLVSSEFRDSLRNLLSHQSDVKLLDQNPVSALGENIRGLVGFVSEEVKILSMVETCRADVVVIAMPDRCEDPGICSHLLLEYPELLVIAVTRNRDAAFLYQQRIEKRESSGASNADILTLIRSRTLRRSATFRGD